MIPMLGFLHPQRLWWGLLIVFLVLLYVLLVLRQTTWHRKRPDALQLVLPRRRRWVRHVAVLLATCSMAALVMAYARPKGITEEPRERATVLLVVDVSKSMDAQDVKPSRMEAAKTEGAEFVRQLPDGFNVALVAFSGTATLMVPPTVDKELVISAINKLEMAPSTAIGEGIYTGLDALALVPPDPENPDAAPPSAMVLLSDGQTNLGRPSRDAAETAKQMGVPITTIAYGTPTGWIEEDGRRQIVSVDYNELAQIARITGGDRYDAKSKADLKKVYAGIARSVGFEKVDKEITSTFIGWGLLCAVLACLGVISIAARWP